MSMTEQQIEQEIQDKGLNAPRLTPDAIDEKIVGAQFWHVDGTTTTICAMVLTNGTVVVGKSACVSAENFDEELGRQIAYDDARNKIWELEGYLLRDNLHTLEQLG